MSDALEISKLLHRTTETSGKLKYRGQDFVWFQDNISSYSGISQIQYNITAAQNSGVPNVWSRAFFAVPFTISMTNIASNQAAAVTLKSGYWNLIDSFTINFCGTSVNTQCLLSNMAQTIRVMLQADPMKLEQSLPAKGFFLDTPETNTISQTGATSYYKNNKVIGTASNNPPSCTGAWVNTFPTTNQGLIKRIKALNWQADGTVMSVASGTQYHMNYSYNNGGVQYVTGVAIIGLSDLCDFFSEKNLGFPLKNGTLNMQVNINQGSAIIGTDGQTSASTFPNGTCPVMVTDQGIAAMSGPSTVTLSIGQYAGSQFNTRLYIPQVTLDPEVPISSPVKREIRFRDVMHFVQPAILGNGTINWSISNSIPGLKRLFIAPFLAQSSQPANLNSWGNLTSACPGMLDTNLLLGNVNVTLAGRNLYQNTVQYQYEQYLNSTATQLLNGDSCPYTAGGLLSNTEWQRGFGLYVFDCTRAPNLVSVEPNSPIFVVLNATNLSALPIDLHCWAEVEVSVSLTETPSTTYAG